MLASFLSAVFTIFTFLALPNLFPYRLLFPELNGRLAPTLWDIQIPPNGESVTDWSPGTTDTRWRGKTVSKTEDGFLILAGYASFETPDTGWSQGPASLVVARHENGRWQTLGRHRFPSSSSWTDIQITEAQARDKRLMLTVQLDWNNPKNSRGYRDGYVFEKTGKKLAVRFSRRIFSGPPNKAMNASLRFSARPWINHYPILQFNAPNQPDRSYEWKGKAYQEDIFPRLRLKPPRKSLPRLKK